MALHSFVRGPLARAAARPWSQSGWMDGWEHTGLQVERIKLLHTVFLASSGWYVHTYTTYTPGAISGTTASNPASSAVWQRLRTELATFCLLACLLALAFFRACPMTASPWLVCLRVVFIDSVYVYRAALLLATNGRRPPPPSLLESNVAPWQAGRN